MFLNNFCGQRKSNRASFWLYILGLVFGIWGLWLHNSIAILLALILLALSHILWRRKKPQLVRSDKNSRLAGEGAWALVSKPKLASPKPVLETEEPEVYDFEEELTRHVTRNT